MFAIAETAEINWIGVIVKRWPNDAVASSTGPTLLKYIPVTSPEVAIPVLVNNPNAFIYLYKLSAPRRLPSWIRAGLHEFSNACLKVCFPCRELVQRIIWPLTSSYPLHVKSFKVSVLTIPSSNEAEAVINLKVEPGSYVSETDLFLHIFWRLLFFSVSDNLSHVEDKDSFGSNGVFKL